MATLPVNDTVKSAWHKVKGAKGTIWLSLIISFLIMLGFSILESITKMYISSLLWIVVLIAQIIGFLLQMGLIYIGICRANDKPINYKMVFHAFRFPLSLNLILLYIIQILIFLPLLIIEFLAVFFYPHVDLIGSIFLAIIGAIAALGILYLSIRLVLSIAFQLDKEIKPWHAIKQSFQASKSNFWRLLAIYIIQILILILCTIPLGIGLIWGIPFAMICYGLIYRQLSVNVDYLAPLQ